MATGLGVQQEHDAQMGALKSAPFSPFSSSDWFIPHLYLPAARCLP